MDLQNFLIKLSLLYVSLRLVQPDEHVNKYSISQKTNERVRFSDDPVVRTAEMRNFDKCEPLLNETQTTKTVPHLQSCHVNEIYLWQSSSELQLHDMSSDTENVNKYSEPDQPLDLRIHCD